MTLPYVQLKDKHGNDMHFGHMGDIMIPAFHFISDFRQHRQDVLDMDLKPDDVIIVGFPKTGTHWHHEIIHMLVAGNAQYAKNMGPGSPREFIDFSPVVKDDNPPGSPTRVFFTHLLFHQLPRQIFERKTKLVYLERNPKDAWVSFYNHTNGHTGILSYDGTWSHFFDLMISGFGYWYGDWFDYVKNWEDVINTQKEVPILVSPFEDLKKDPVGQIEKLDRFLGTNRGRELCEQIADACSFTKLKKAKEIPPEYRQKIFKDDAPGFYRKGDIGDWKNWFTVAQNELFDEVYKKRMAGSTLSYTYLPQ